MKYTSLLILALSAFSQENDIVQRPIPNEQHIVILQQGVEVWNAWRKENPNVIPDLAGAILVDMDLSVANIENVVSGDQVVRLNLSGAILVGADIRRADLTSANLSNANLQSADLRDATLFSANLRGARLNKANLNKANLNLVDMQNATLSGANLSQTGLWEAELSNTKLNGVDFTDSQLNRANLSNAIINGAILQGTELVNADLSQTVLSKADLQRAVLTGAKLVGADLRYSRLNATIFDPESIPSARKLIGATGLDSLNLIARHLDTGVIAYDIGAIVELRESAKTAGLRDMERELTCAIERIRNWNPNRSWYARILSWLFFDITCGYGSEPTRPLWLLFYNIAICSVLYGFLLYRIPNTQIFIDFEPRRKNSRPLSIELFRLGQCSEPRNARQPTYLSQKAEWLRRAIASSSRGTRDRIRGLIRILRISWYAISFSIQSSFNIGFREFNIGNWLGRLQFRPYTLYARGPLRLVSGIQSLVGVYLLALWLLCTFGHPFG